MLLIQQIRDKQEIYNIWEETIRPTKLPEEVQPAPFSSVNTLQTACSVQPVNEYLGIFSFHYLMSSLMKEAVSIVSVLYLKPTHFCVKLNVLVFYCEKSDYASIKPVDVMCIFSPAFHSTNQLLQCL